MLHREIGRAFSMRDFSIFSFWAVRLFLLSLLRDRLPKVSFRPPPRNLTAYFSPPGAVI